MAKITFKMSLVKVVTGIIFSVFSVGINAQTSTLSVLSSSATVCAPDSVVLAASFNGSVPSGGGQYRLKTDFHRRDIGIGMCYTPINDSVVASVISPVVSPPSGSINDFTFYGTDNGARRGVKVSGYYIAQTYLQKKNTAEGWDNVGNVATTQWVTSLPTPDQCHLNAPQILVNNKNANVKFGINGTDYYPTQSNGINSGATLYGQLPIITEGSCRNINMTNIIGDGANATVIVKRGIWTLGPVYVDSVTGMGLLSLFYLDSVVADSIYLSFDATNHKYPDFDLISAFPANFFQDNKDYTITLRMDKNECDVSTGSWTVSFGQTFHLYRPSTPTINTLKVNNASPTRNCSTTPTVVSSCSPVNFTFSNNTFDSVTVTAKKYTVCPSSGYDSLKVYTAYPSGGIDLRELLPRSSSNLTTATSGLYKITVHSRLCNVPTADSTFYINVVNTPTLNNLKVNNTAVNKLCTQTPTPVYRACDSIKLTFSYTIFDSFTISAKKYLSCPVPTGYDSLKVYTSYPATGSFDLRSLLPRSNYNDLTTATEGMYAITIHSRLCGTATADSTFYIAVSSSTPTISNLKLNGNAVVTNCTNASSQSLFACNPFLLTFDHSVFDQITIKVTPYNSCGTSGSDVVEQYTEYPTNGFDLREQLPSLSGTYKITVSTILCGNTTTDNVFYFESNPDPTVIGNSSCFKFATNNTGGNLITPSQNSSNPSVICGNAPSLSASCSTTDLVGGYWRLVIDEYTSPTSTPQNIVNHQEALTNIATQITSVPFNSFASINQYFYWVTNTAGLLYKVYWTIGNVCGESTSIGWFTDGLSTCKTDGSEDVTGINDIDENAISIYPNPSEDIVNVALPQNAIENNNIIIQTIDGRTVNVPFKKSDNIISLDFQNYQSGVYLLNITVNQKRLVRKLIIE